MAQFSRPLRAASIVFVPNHTLARALSPRHNGRMPQFVMINDCYRIMAGANVTEAELLFAADRHHCFSITKDFTRLTLASWVSDDRLILVDGTITKTAQIDERTIVELMAPLIVLALKPELPAGRVTREHGIEELLAFAAESFGVPVRCHTDEPFSRLYSRPWDGRREIERERLVVSHAYAVCGSFEVDAKWAHRVYSIDLTKYFEWVKRHVPTAISNESRLDP